MRQFLTLSFLVLGALPALAQQPQSVFDEMGDVRITTALEPCSTDSWITLLTVTPTDAYGGGVEKWILMSHPGQQRRPEEFEGRGRVVFDGKTVTVGIAEEPSITFAFTGTSAAHLLGSWRARRETEPTTHERLLNAHLGSFARNCESYR